MKRILFIIALVVGSRLTAQQSHLASFSAGIKLGYSLHTLSGDLTKSHPDDNLLAGCWLQLKLSKKWTAQTELLLVDKGIGGIKSGKSPHWVNLHYIEMPLLFQYHRNKIYVEAGPALGYLINYAEHLYGSKSPELVGAYPFMKRELSFNAGIGCIVSEKWTLGIRFSHSLLPVRKAVPLVSKVSYNRLIAFSITRIISRKRAGEEKEF